ncbi:MAG TPA: hypothetical protein VHV81_17250 [Steroidobacteraceae bacterium]|jgi:hypothetical protein|nr:hypothetical protein [Steroidobacteraceae bacterium]
MDEDTSKGTPQFATAEFAPPDSASKPCAACRNAITGSYYQIDASKVCPECAKKIQQQLPKDSHAAFVRAVIYGIGGALAGFALYVAFALITGLVIGWVSLAVGFIVGKAMSRGSGGVGGRRYQMAAVLLTYLAVSMSAVPIAVHQWGQQHQAQAGDAAAPHAARMNLAEAIGVLALLGVASPFLELKDPVHGIIGLVILFVGIRFAWRFTAGRTVTVSGPHAPPTPAAV